MLLHDIPKERGGIPSELQNFISYYLERFRYLRFRIYINRPATLAPPLPHTVMFLHEHSPNIEDEMWDTTWLTYRDAAASEGFVYDPNRVEVVYWR